MKTAKAESEKPDSGNRSHCAAGGSFRFRHTPRRNRKETESGAGEFTGIFPFSGLCSANLRVLCTSALKPGFLNHGTHESHEKEHRNSVLRFRAVRVFCGLIRFHSVLLHTDNGAVLHLSPLRGSTVCRRGPRVPLRFTRGYWLSLLGSWVRIAANLRSRGASQVEATEIVGQASILPDSGRLEACPTNSPARSRFPDTPRRRLTQAGFPLSAFLLPAS